MIDLVTTYNDATITPSLFIYDLNHSLIGRRIKVGNQIVTKPFEEKNGHFGRSMNITNSIVEILQTEDNIALRSGISQFSFIIFSSLFRRRSPVYSIR